MSADTQERSFKILLVDDSPTQMGLLRSLFKRRGHEVMEARNGAEALLALAAERPDIVVSDCYMPLIDGYQLCRLLKDDRGTRHLPVLLLTAETRGLGRFWAKTCGADKFLVKANGLDNVVDAAMSLVPEAEEAHERDPKPPLDTEDLGVDAIQRRLARALEHRLLETTLRDAIARLYTADPDAQGLAKGFLDLLQSMVLPGALAVVHQSEEGLLAMGAYGRCVADHERDSLGRALQEGFAAGEPLELAWERIDDPEERRTTLRDPIRVTLPVTVPSGATNGLLGLFLERRTYHEHGRLFEIAADELGRLFTLEAGRLRLYHQAIQDPLTGLHNRRHTLELLHHEALQSSRFKHPLTVMLIDLDHFKPINDRFGHAAGDRVLSTVAQRLAFGLRKVDRLGRMGGDEFLVFCPQTDKAGAALLAERLLDSVARSAIPNAPDGRLSLSIGLATWRGEEDSVEQMLARADRRLYRAKAEGRARIVGEGD
ncbi:MAG TPA: diguanylate cyclase [Holophagaceae bacterium]|nr:diguanylate cyclase [Holophagaceae bacterium]